MLEYIESRSLESRLAALEAAQQLAWSSRDSLQRRRKQNMARNAVRLTPLCADALNILAELSSSPQEALLYYERALHAAEFALAPKTLTDYAGGFWVYIETRPYMTALLGFATALSDLDKTGEAIECCRRLLALNSPESCTIAPPQPTWYFVSPRCCASTLCPGS